MPRVSGAFSKSRRLSKVRSRPKDSGVRGRISTGSPRRRWTVLSSSPTVTAVRRNGQMRRLWIVWINAAARQNDLSYSRLMNGLKKADITVDRKVLADLAVTEPAGFAQLAAKGEASPERLGIP